MTITEFLQQNNITMLPPKRITNRDDGFVGSSGSTYWYVCLERHVHDNYRKIYTYFTQGAGYKAELPTINMVFDSLLLDAQSGDSTDLYEFMEKFAYTDHREANKVYKACVKMRRDMIDFLGEDLLNFAIYELEY